MKMTFRPTTLEWQIEEGGKVQVREPRSVSGSASG